MSERWATAPCDQALTGARPIVVFPPSVLRRYAGCPIVHERRAPAPPPIATAVAAPSKREVLGTVAVCLVVALLAGSWIALH